MKTFFIFFSGIATFTACSNAVKEKASQPDPGGTKAPTYNQVQLNNSLSNLVTHYIQIQKALADDDAKGAARAAGHLKEAVSDVDADRLGQNEKKVFGEQQEEIHENADHIKDNPDKIDHQRSHFDMLSDAMYLLVKGTGAGRTLYKFHCPKHNNNRGAIWLSEVREIRNPYFGNTKDTCGEIKEVLN